MTKNKLVPNKKLCIIDSRIRQTHIDYFSLSDRKEEIRNTDFVLPGIFVEMKIPRGCDFYLLHLTDISLKDLEDLRQEQPWSLIYCRCGQGYEIIPEVRKDIDRLFTDIMEKSYYDEMLDALHKSERGR